MAACLVVLGLCSCNSTKFLADDQSLLVDSTIKMDQKKVKNRSDLLYELSTLEKQDPNTNIFFLFPREYIYLANSKAKDTTSIDRFLRNSIGEPPTIYRDSLSQVSADNMRTYLRYRGYFDAETFYEEEERKQRAEVTYYVEPKRQYYIDSLHYSTQQPAVDSLLELARSGSLLKTNGPLNLNVYEQEKKRLATYFQNQGYAFFTTSAFGRMDVDTTRRSGYADLYLEVLPPARDSIHRRYRIGTVTVLPDYDALNPDLPIAVDTTVEGIQLRYRAARPRVKIPTLVSNVFLRPGRTYRLLDFEKTNRQLSGLGIYRFVRITQRISETEPETIDFLIQLTPNSKMEVGVDFDLNYTNRSIAGTANNLIGLSLSPTFSNRNLFRGAELLTTSLRGGVEVNPVGLARDTTSFFNTVDLAAQATLYLPRFLDWGVYRWLYGIPFSKDRHLLNEDFYTALREKANTRFSLAYEYLLIRDFYSYNQFNARFGYDFKKSATSSYRINHLAVDVLRPTTEKQFEDILAGNPFLARSFGEQYFLSFLLRDIDYIRNGRPNRRGQSIFIDARAEVAGAEIWAANSLSNDFRNREEEWTPRDSAIFAQYVLLEADVRYTKSFTPERSMVTRINLGLALPFGFAEDVPYVKQFWVGGANSMRSWAPRGLGPGGLLDSTSLTTINAQRRFQTGDILLEGNLEYRFPLIGPLKGALFVDAGNVWTRRRDSTRCGSQFLLSKRTEICGGDNFVHQPFYRQIAVGGGFGLRFDLSYFIFRLDMGLQLRRPFPSERAPDGSVKEADYWNRFDSFRLRDIAFQLGLGYPF